MSDLTKMLQDKLLDKVMDDISFSDEEINELKGQIKKDIITSVKKTMPRLIEDVLEDSPALDEVFSIIENLITKNLNVSFKEEE